MAAMATAVDTEADRAIADAIDEGDWEMLEEQVGGPRWRETWHHRNALPQALWWEAKH